MSLDELWMINLTRFLKIIAVFFAVQLMIGPTAAKKLVPESQFQLIFSYAPLVKKLTPAVVNVYAARQVRNRSPFAGDPFFEQFFGPNAFGTRRPETSRSLGSGVIIGEDGVVVTNHHVIENADQVKVALSDGREFSAEIVLIDKSSDLAVLVMDTDETFPTVPIGDSEDLEVGDLVLAIGNPFGVGQTVTSGIVSALARSQGGIKDFNFFIQTDASINPGNSGGALVDMQGRLIGINTAIFSRSGGSNGIGFAVPSNMVRVVLQSVREGSPVIMRPWLGAQFQPVTSDIAESLGLPRPHGALVAGVLDGSPAQRGGLKLGDVILEMEGKELEHLNALGYRLATSGVGRDIEIVVLRKNKRQKLTLRLEKAPEDPPRDERTLQGRTPFTGARVANLSPLLALERELPATLTGVIVTGILQRSTAQRIGLRVHDIIVAINGIEITSTEQLADLLNEPMAEWEYTIQRGNRRFTRYLR